MDILYNKVNHHIFLIANRIEKGIYDEPNTQKWGVYDENEVLGNVFFVGDELTTTHINEESIPEDYQPMDTKYLFVDGEFVRNPDWQPPEEPAEVRVNRLEEAMAELAEMMFGGEL